jgi:Leucine-rich repeat (LRR) protein
MYQYKLLYLLFIVCWCSLLMKCDADALYRNIQKRSSSESLQCDQYANDLEILSQFPFTVGLDYKQQGPTKSTAILESDNSTVVVMIQLRQAGSTVPESVFCLKNLQSLDIMNMFFENGIVPDTLSNLQELHTLTMTNTPIIQMTDKLATLEQLQMLSLDNCALSYLPNLGGLANLSTVSFPNNRLSKLEGLVKPRMVSLYKNLFTEIPTLEEPDALVRLNMNFNPVTDMTSIMSFSNLTEIRLSETKISVIPSDIHELEKLNIVDLSHTEISYVPRAMLKMPRLQYLIVQRNPFSDEEINSIKMELSSQQSKVQLLI